MWARPMSRSPIDTTEWQILQTGEQFLWNFIRKRSIQNDNVAVQFDQLKQTNHTHTHRDQPQLNIQFTPIQYNRLYFYSFSALQIDVSFNLFLEPIQIHWKNIKNTFIVSFSVKINGNAFKRVTLNYTIQMGWQKRTTHLQRELSSSDSTCSDNEDYFMRAKVIF